VLSCVHSIPIERDIKLRSFFAPFKRILFCFPFLFVAHIFYRSYFLDANRRESCEPQNRPFYFVSVISEKAIRNKRNRVHGNNHSRAPPVKEALPAKPVFIEIKSKRRKPHPVKHSLKHRRHCRPPVRIKKRQMVAPPYFILDFKQVRLKLLYYPVPLVKNRVKRQISQINALDFVSRFARAALVAIGK